MKGLKNNIILICFALMLFNCSQPSELREPVEKIMSKYSIPDSIIHKSNMIIIFKVGQIFFDSYIKLDSSKSRYSPPDPFCVKNPTNCADYLVRPFYQMEYKFNPTNDNNSNTYIEFVMNINGTLIPSQPLYGIPNCPNNDCWDKFQIITKEKAIEIAKQNGFEAGIEDWTISFHFYDGALNNYVWEIRNTLTEDKSVPSQYEASGKVLLINAMDGSIFQLSGWMITT